jgi:hypothetical protein
MTLGPDFDGLLAKAQVERDATGRCFLSFHYRRGCGRSGDVGLVPARGVDAEGSEDLRLGGHCGTHRVGIEDLCITFFASKLALQRSASGEDLPCLAIWNENGDPLAEVLRGERRVPVRRE